MKCPWRGPGSSISANSAIFKVEGLDPAGAARKPAPAANPLGVIVVHLGLSERLWNPGPSVPGSAWTWPGAAHMFELPDGWGVEEAVAFDRQESARADAVLDQEASLDPPSRADSAPPRSAGPSSTSSRRRHATWGTWTSLASCSTAAWAAERHPARFTHGIRTRFRGRFWGASPLLSTLAPSSRSCPPFAPSACDPVPGNSRYRGWGIPLSRQVSAGRDNWRPA